MPSITLVRVHELDDVREIIRQALGIARDYSYEDGTAQLVFGRACDLLSARIPLAQPDSPLDLSALRLTG